MAYHDATKEELLDKIAELENRVEELESKEVSQDSGETMCVDLVLEVLRNAPIPIFIRIGEQCVFANQTLSDVLEVDGPEELVGQDIKKWLTPADLPRIRQREHQVIEEGQVTEPNNFRFLAEGGQLFYTLEFVAQPFEFKGEKAILAMGRDLTPVERSSQVAKESTNLFRTVFEAAEDAIFVLDRDMITECNTKTLDMFGLEKKNIIGNTPWQISPLEQPDGRSSKDKAREVINAAFDGTPQFFEWHHLRLDGKPFETEVSLNRVEIDGRPFLLAVCRDISERLQAERDLKKHAEWNDAILATSMDGFWEIDTQGNILEVNDAYCALVGYSREELLIMTVADIEAEESASEITEHIKQVRAEGSQRFETRHRRKNGSLIDLEISINFLSREGGRLYAFFRDITERKLNETRIRDSEERFRAIFDLSGFGAVVREVSGGFIQCNRAFLDMFGLDSGDLETIDINDLTHPEDLERSMLLMSEVLTGALDGFRLEKRYVRKDGSVFWGDVIVRAVKWNGDQVAASLALIADVTERKLVEQRLIESRNDLRTLTSKLALVEEQERRRIAVGLHDSAAQNLALASLKLAMLQTINSPDERDELVDETRLLIEETARELRTLSLDLSPPTLYEVGLEQALSSLAERFQVERRIKCTFKSDDHKKSLGQDASTLVYRCTSELLANVAKHAEATQTTLEIRQINDHLDVIITDDGKGMNPTRKNVQSKGGFGLFSIRERLHAFGGELTINSKPGYGFQAKISIPLQGEGHD